MKKYKIKYQKGNDIFIKIIEGQAIEEAIYKLYMSNDKCIDILKVEEIKNG